MSNHNGRTPSFEPNTYRRDDDRYMDRGGQPGGEHYYADRQDSSSTPDRDRFGRGYGFEDNNLGTGGYTRGYERERSGYGHRSGSSWSGARGPHYGKGPQGFQRSDDRIKELVSEALHDDDQVDATGIRVEVKDGEVALVGTVEDRRTKRMAEDCALRITGVRDVQNQLKIADHS